MKVLGKLLLIASVLAFASESFTQTIGVKAGLNFANMLVKDDDGTYSDDNTHRPGIHVGPIVEVPINEMFSVEGGILLSRKGYIDNDTETIMGEKYIDKENLGLSYIEIPITAKASFVVGDAKIYGVLGPYIGLGLNGKVKIKEGFKGETDSYKIDLDWGPDEIDDLKRPDLGVIVGAGIELCSIQVGVTFGLGLANVSASTAEGGTIKNRVFGISAAYKIADLSELISK